MDSRYFTEINVSDMRKGNMDLLSSSPSTSIRCLTDEETDQNMLQDLMLAAELGKSLLERNKVLENLIKTHESTIEDQKDEIQYMKRQNAAMKEMHESRMKIYEHLEVSVNHLEHVNQCLLSSQDSNKKLLESTYQTIENLEARNDDLQKKLDEVTEERDALLRRKSADESTKTQANSWKAPGTRSGSMQQSAALPGRKTFPDRAVLVKDEGFTELSRQLQDAQNQRAREQQKVCELEQQLALLAEENNALEEHLKECRNKSHVIKSLEDEISTLQEVREGQLCGRCLRSTESKIDDDLYAMLNQEEYDEIPISKPDTSDSRRDSESQGSSSEDGDAEDRTSPYTDLEEKYEVLAKVQREWAPKRKNTTPTAGTSLQDELKIFGKSDDLKNSAPKRQEKTKSMIDVTSNIDTVKKSISSTSDISEADTLSSGYVEETVNTATQTEDGADSFLCSIDDGVDCKFRIYVDNNLPDGRFPEVSEFKQLFEDVLAMKRRKDTLADDFQGQSTTNSDVSHPQSSIPEKDTVQSVESSSLVSSALSKPVQKLELSEASNEVDEKKTDGSSKAKNQEEFDYILMNGTKKPTKRQRRRKQTWTVINFQLAQNSPNVVSPTPSLSGKKFRPLTTADLNKSLVNESCSYAGKVKSWSPNTTLKQQITQNCLYNSNEQKENNRSFIRNGHKPSMPSEDVARLKRLDKSFSEVLLLPNKWSVNHRK